MNRGDVHFAALDPTVGHEIQKTRPVLIISNNTANQYSQLLTIIPITSQTKKVFDFEVFISTKDSGLSKDSKIQCHQIRTISKKRLTSKKPSGKLTSAKLKEIETALKLHLGMSHTT